MCCEPGVGCFRIKVLLVVLVQLCYERFGCCRFCGLRGELTWVVMDIWFGSYGAD